MPFGSSFRCADHFLRGDIDLDELARKFTGGDHEAAVGRKVGMVHAFAIHGHPVDDLHGLASRKSMRFSRSAITIAYLPSGVKYMLYGSSTWIVYPVLPVAGSIMVS